MTQALGELERIFRRLALLGEASGVLQWDMAAVMPEPHEVITGFERSTPAAAKTWAISSAGFNVPSACSKVA